MCSVEHIFFLLYLLKIFPYGDFGCTKVYNYFLRTIHNSNMYLHNRVNIGKSSIWQERGTPIPHYTTPSYKPSDLSCLTIFSLAKSHLLLVMHLSQCFVSQGILRF